MSTVSPDSVAQDQIQSFYERWHRLEEEKAAIGGDLKEMFAEAKGNGFSPKALRESFRRVRNINDADQQEHDAIVDLYVAALTGARPAHTRESAPKEAVTASKEINTKAPADKALEAVTAAEEIDHDPETGEIIVSHPRHGAGGAEDEAAVATVAAPSSAQLIQAETPNEAAGELVAPELDAADHGVVTSGGVAAGETHPGGENVADRPVHVSEEPGRGAASVNAPAEGDTHSAPIPQPVEGTTPTSTADGDRGGQVPPPSQPAPVVPSNVTSFRTHNPETHFLNSEGLPRLHGCQKGEMCGSAEPRKRLCFPCSVAHDGPTPQVEGGGAA